METFSIAANTGLPRSKSKVFENATDEDVSKSSGRPVVFGDTSGGRHIMVVYEQIDEETVYPVTAYEVPRTKRR